MALLGRIIGIFLAVWLVFYVVAYFLYLAPDEPPHQGGKIQQRVKYANTPFAPTHHQEHNVSMTILQDNVPSIMINPFLSPTCEFQTKHARATLKDRALDGVTGLDGVAVVIPARNENKGMLLATVESIMRNSGNELRHIIIIDDNSHVPIESWDEWNELYEKAEARFGDGKKIDVTSPSSVLRIVRSAHRRGVAGAKAYGASLLNDPVSIVVFADAHVIVSHDWLIPLITALEKHPQAIVYPSIDIIDAATGDIIKGENAVGAFDWAFNFRWELLDLTNLAASKRRLPLSTTDSGGHPITDHDLVSSPAAPGIFAMKLRYYKYIGGMNVNLYPWGQDSVELSLRTWLCGGSVVRQPCSRVAHAYQHLYEDSIISGVMQAQVDKNVLSVAEMWLSPQHRETVFQARFVDRVPYTVDISLDARQPGDFFQVQKLTQDACESFAWYLAEVYPGLAQDRAGVEIDYKNHLASEFFHDSMKPLLDQYNKVTTSSVDKEEVTAMQRRENQPAEITLKNRKRNAIPAEVEAPHLATPDELHDARVRETNECSDRPVASGKPDHCAVAATPEACEHNRASFLFACPKTCGWCDAYGLTCVDYYQKKCPVWKAEGQCMTKASLMKNVCRQSCGFCTARGRQQQIGGTNIAGGIEAGRSNSAGGIGAEAGASVPPLDEVSKLVQQVQAEGDKEAKALMLELEHNAPPAPPVVVNHNTPPRVQAEAAEKVGLVGTGTETGTGTNRAADPYVAQVQYSTGLLPDPPFTANTACALNDRPHGKLLAYMTVHPAPQIADNPPRIFCGIYTMEKNHNTNVQATKETWAKKCTGFLAFSTATDVSIPAFKIDHEGKEEYNNMWQKSRSIWKYIAQHFADQFDYFLMGGDDMFYVMENLQHYLMSEEIVKMQNAHSGMFLGRRFYPSGNVDEQVFNSGGAGYIIDQHALKILGPMLDDPRCFPHQVGFWEDVNIANCLRKTAIIIPHDTRDGKQRERFHPFTPGQHLDYRIPRTNPDWYPKYNPWLKEGYDCCAPDSISFHYSPADTTRQMYSYLYHCENKHKAA